MVNFVTSVKARTSIRNFLRNILKTDAINLGQRLLKSSLKELDVSLKDIPNKTLMYILSEYKFNSLDHIRNRSWECNTETCCITYGSIFQENNKETSFDIEGSEGLVMSYAKCCYPLPGDNIVGHISQGKGIVVHDSCKSGDSKNIRDYIDLRWSGDVDNYFNASIMVEVENVRAFLLKYHLLLHRVIIILRV